MPITAESLRAALLRSIGSNNYNNTLARDVDHADIAKLLNNEFADTFVCEGQHVPVLIEMCPDCEPWIDSTCDHAGQCRDSYCVVFHRSAEDDKYLQMNRAQLESIKRSIDRLLADPVYPCRQKAKR